MTRTIPSSRLLHFSKALALCCFILTCHVWAQQNSPDFINEIESIDFRRGEQGEARVLVFLQQSSAAVDVTEQNGQIQLDFHNTRISDDLLYQLDVLDFATVVKGIETFREADNARLVIDTLDSFSYSYQQIDQVFHLVVQKKSAEQTKSAAAGQYVGRAISLNFQDIPVRTVLQIIADYNGFNLVTSDSVTGNITLRLDGTPWDQALDIVLKVRGLDKRMDGNILMIAPSDELAAREAKELQAQQQVEQLEPLNSEFLPINYAKAADIAALLNNKEATLLSARGNVAVDDRTNTLLVKDTATTIENVRRLLRRLDVPVKQVLIESRMVTVKDNVRDEIGLRWGFSDQQNDKAWSGTAPGANNLAGGTVPALNDRWNVNLPVANPAGSIAFHVTKFADGTLLDLELSALEQENKGEIIASPRITTANQKKARIEQGTEIPYLEASSSGATTVTFKKAVLSLEVTPQITPDNKIILDLEITQDTRGETVSTGNGPAQAIDTQRIQTQVLVDNGATVVLGGIYQQQMTNTTSKVPVFGDIPYVGNLFKRRNDFNEKTELLIFVTPKILTESL
ncbi:type IV pilus secretin PilQ [Rheinheimera sp.]|uniref:type IV pilus secretin PilQ n=1 Tax=Rheinheimera sp. TaxID=1869214 RepID=UPI00262833A3|nr:type IV pilus secretin PilQ family protein [Rheinheimera sp.]MCA1928961.1 type IV pilus secretin PilQ family protein [Rheinheimera sp.]